MFILDSLCNRVGESIAYYSAPGGSFPVNIKLFFFPRISRCVIKLKENKIVTGFSQTQ